MSVELALRRSPAPGLPTSPGIAGARELHAGGSDFAAVRSCLSRLLEDLA